MVKILFVTYGGGHVNMTVPVACSLAKDDSLQVEVLGMTTARSVLEKNNINCFSFSDLPIDEAALTYGKFLVDEQAGHPLVPTKESIAYMGLSFQCLVKNYGLEEAEKLYASKGRQSFLPVAVMEKLFYDRGYDLIVATNSPRAERAAIIAARHLDIPSMCMVDLFPSHGIKWIGQKGYSDKVCVLTESVKTVLLKAGREPDEIVVTGNPAFDYLASPSIAVKAKKLREKKGWGAKKVILWCSQPEPEVHPFSGERGDPELPLKIEKSLHDTCKKRGWHLLVRPHPSENLEKRKYIKGVAYSRTEDLPALLKAVDVIVVTSSTVGLEAVLLGRPVVALSMSMFSADMPFSSMGMAVGVDSLSELGAALDRVLRKKFSIDIDLPEIGSATKNVVKEIHALIQGSGGLGV